MSSPAQHRWAAFLGQIRERHRALLDQAEAAVRDALPACNYDPVPLGTAWSAVTYRLQELEKRIMDTWGDQVEAVFDAEDAPMSVQDAERQKGEDLAFQLENDRWLCEARVFANAARQLYAASVATQKEHACPGCGAPLEVPITYRAVNLRCAHCGGLSSFEPGVMARNVVAFGSHQLAAEAAANEFLGMRQAERQLHAAQPPIPLALLKAYERAQIAYWQRFIGARAVLEPELRDLGHEVRSRMEQWYTMHAEFEPSWVAAGRPRERI